MVPFDVGEAASNERMYGQLVSDNYFSTLGLTPAAGRFFRPDEVSRSTNAAVLVIARAGPIEIRRALGSDRADGAGQRH